MGILRDRLSHAWNAFLNNEEETPKGSSFGFGNWGSSRPDKVRRFVANERSILASIYTRIAMDVAATPIKHVRLDENDRYVETINSGLNNCLTLRANIDQGARAFRQDIIMTMFDGDGVAAIVPVDTDTSIQTGGFDIATLRVGKVVSWYARHVRVRLYDDRTAQHREITLPKESVAIVENPLAAIMNEPNSTYQRLIRKLNLLDAVDEQSSSGKLDLIIQLPYVIKSEQRQQQANQRRENIEMQLKGSQYGIAYTDSTEKITQLNRPAENNMMKQVEYLTNMLHNQLGVTEAVFNGSASEQEMLNYHNRTVEPILAAVTEALKWAFLTKTARTQHQSIEYFRDPFKNVPLSSMAEIADKFTRNEIMSSNEFRSVIGMKPSDDPNADKLLNKNLPAAEKPIDQGHMTAVPSRLALEQ